MMKKPQANGAVSPAPTSEVLDVTPALARAWLERNHEKNRNVDWHRVTALENDMRADAWRVTHQGIAFNEDGQLIDGQHRLHAIVQSNCTVRLLVVRGLGEFGDPIDCGRPRSVAMLSGYGSRITATINALRMLEQGCALTTPMTVHEAHEIYSHHSAALEIVLKLSHVATIRTGLLAALAYAWPVDSDKIADFGEKVATGEMIAAGHPAFAFRRWVERQARLQPFEMACAGLNCCRYAITGERLTSVYTTPDGYRWVTTKRRGARIAHTPTPEMVPPR